MSRIEPQIAMSRPRLVLALVLAPLVLAALLTVLAGLVATSTAASRADALLRTAQAAPWLFGALLAFSLSFGALGATVLDRLGWYGALQWSAMGGLLGAALALGWGLLGQGQVDPLRIAVAAGLSWVLFVLIRRLAGLHRG